MDRTKIERLRVSSSCNFLLPSICFIHELLKQGMAGNPYFCTLDQVREIVFEHSIKYGNTFKSSKMIEPSQEPIPGSPSKATRNEETHFLSPVSKLEIAKQLAAKEQQKRVDSVCSRLVEAKKVENLNRLHLGRKGTHVYLSRDESVKYGVFSTIKSKVVHAFNFVHNFTTSISNESDTTIHAPTRELLR